MQKDEKLNITKEKLMDATLVSWKRLTILSR